jgi:uncharacterized protein (UPF0333 family)
MTAVIKLMAITKYILFINTNRKYLEFILLSTAVLLAQVNTGYFVAIQGMRQFKNLAMSNVVAGVISLVFCSLICPINFIISFL